MAQEKHSVEEDDHHHYHGVDRAEEHVSVNDALKILLASIRETKPESLTLPESCGRILYEEIRSPADLPKLARSTRDGYAVNISENIENDTEYHAFRIVGEVKIGTAPRIKIRPGEAARVATGSYNPAGANAVIMVEYSNVENGVLRFAHPLRIGENIVSPGEDIKKGELLLSRGSRVHPQHLALFSILGVTRLRAYSKPRVAVLSTGDELEDSPSWVGSGGLKWEKGNRKSLLTFDSNRPFLKSILAELGAESVDLGIAPDNFQKIRSKLVKSLEFDAVILSAGSSVGERDYVTRAVESINGLTTLVHGVAMRPSSPTGLATYKGKPVILFPGFPTSAIVSFYVFGRPAVLKLAGSSSTQPPLIKAKIMDEYSGKKGLTHFLRVLVRKEGGGYVAFIVRPTEAQYSSWLRVANGIAIIGENGSNTAVKPGEEVSVFLIAEISDGNFA